MRPSLVFLVVTFFIGATVQGGEPEIDRSFGSSHPGPPIAGNNYRAPDIPSSEDLDNAADLIINGEVRTTQDSLKKIDSSYVETGPEHMMHAFVQVLHTFKGMTDEDQIDFYYRTLAPDLPLPKLPPNHVILVRGKRYRFFLKKNDTGGYVGVLDGKPDDQYEVQRLGPDEADDAPYLTTKDALAMAKDYYASLKPPPLPSVDYIRGNMESTLAEQGAFWVVYFRSNTGDGREFQIAIQDGKASEFTTAR